MAKCPEFEANLFFVIFEIPTKYCEKKFQRRENYNIVQFITIMNNSESLKFKLGEPIAVR